MDGYRPSFRIRRLISDDLHLTRRVATAAHRRSDRRRDDLYAGGLRKRVQNAQRLASGALVLVVARFHGGDGLVDGFGNVVI